LQVMAHDNDVDQALRVLKKKMQREGVFREMKRRRFYEKRPKNRIGNKLKRSAVPESSLARRPNARDL
jgi:small subunit ribosomal protein S21